MNNASLELGGDNWAAKDTKLLASTVSDDSGRFYPREFTFARGSNLSATRVNADGLIEKGYENLLTYSNDFSNVAWTKSLVGLNANQVGYDGSNDAWVIEKSGSTGRIYYYSTDTAIITMSVYVKANTLNWMRLTQGGKIGYYNLADGTLGATSNGIDQTITSVGNGWYKCTLTANKTTAGQVSIYPADGDGDISGTSGSIYIQDVMLNQGLVALPYIESGASAAKAGVLENEPRIDYSSGTASLLLEPQRTNVLPHSEYLSSSTYTFNRISVNDNSIVSPENKMNASKLIVSSGTGYTRLFRATGGLGSQVVSIFAKAGEMNAISVSSYTGNAYLYAMYNLTNGTLINSNADDTGIQDMGDGWYRIWVYVANSFGRYAHISVGQSTDSPSPLINTTGNNVDGIYAYGFQVEQDATYPTSYIPTYGTSQTRLKDAAPFPATFNFGTSGDGESGTIVVKTIVNGLTSNNRFNFFSNGGSANWYWNGDLLYAQTTGGSRQFDLDSSASSKLGTEVKLCMRKSANTLSCFFNGDDKGSIDIGSETIRYFDEFSTYFVSQSIVEFEEFPTALTDNECIELTTI